MNTRLLIWIGAIMLCGFMSGGAEENDAFVRMAGNGSGPTYSVTISRNDIRKILVSAMLPLYNDTLYMSQSGFAPLTDGYAGFVHDLEAEDDRGHAVHLRALGKGIWIAEMPVPASAGSATQTVSSPRIHLKYSVEIGHDKVAWKVSGAFAKAYATDDVVFFAGRVLFIAAKGSDQSRPDRDPLRTLVHFVIPAGWKVTTPFEEVDQEPNSFSAKDLSDLWVSGNMIGRCEQEEIKVGKLRVVIAGNESMKAGVGLIRGALTKIIDEYAASMGGAPGGKLAIMGCVAPLSPGGETFPRSISLLFNRPPGIDNKTQWGYLIAHEVFHLWNGASIMPADQPQVEWFAEGFTDYMSKLTELRTGFITEPEFFQQIASSYDSYISNSGKISLMEAGKEKGANYDLIYGGGLTAAMALDILCRKATDNKSGFVTIMRKMYAEFGMTGKPYRFEDVERVCGETAGGGSEGHGPGATSRIDAAAGVDVPSFFREFIAGRETIPLAAYCSLLGLELRAGQGVGAVISRKMNAVAEEREMLEGVLYK